MSTTSEIVERLRKRTIALEHPLHREVFQYVASPLCTEAADRLDELERENAALREALRETKFFLLMLHGSCRSDGHGYSNVNIPNVDLAELREKVRAALAGSGER